MVLDGMESRLMLTDNDPQKLTLDEVLEKLNNRYERKHDHDDDDASSNGDPDNHVLVSLNDDTEAAFVAFMKKVKGTCNRCGKCGHKGADCHSNDSNVSTLRGTCHYCDMRGHKVENCELKKAHQRGIGLKQDEKAQLAIKDSDNESFDELGF